ncbi:hypothetical protein SDC9_07891 [bioreactor metagenome]|uniref:Uncharacterized protein n=1 Tax=bioreactor metagenome TaxID=1076179 RepID=A0A644T601_9ZZZZ|nr:hypothetical protein [Candidatus Elulimicrobiales bacterium]
MGNFFKLMWRKGWKFILILAVIWLIYFLITFFYPNTFNFLRNKNTSKQTYSTIEQVKIPLRYRIYNFFFNNSNLKGFSGRNNVNPTTTEILQEENVDTGPYVWGTETGATYRNKNFLLAEDLYVYPNIKKNAVAQNFRFDDVLVKEGGNNILKADTVITGEINTHYLNNPFFNIDIYDAAGSYLYSIYASGRILEEDPNLLTFSATNIASYNFYGYKGEGFLAIWTDNPEVESILISKITIE